MMAQRQQNSSSIRGLSLVMIAAANVKPASSGPPTFASYTTLKEFQEWRLDAVNWFVGAEFQSAASGNVTTVNLLGVRKNSSPVFDVVLELWSGTAGTVGLRKPDTKLGTSNAVAASSLPILFGAQSFTFSPAVPVTQNSLYWIVAKSTNITTIGGTHYAAIQVQENDSTPLVGAGYTDDAMVTWFGDGNFYDEFLMTVTGTA